MADIKRTIEIIFAGVDQTGGAISSVGAGIDSFAADVGKIASPLASVTESILKFNAAIAALGVAVIGFSVNEAIKFESAQLDLQKVMSESEGSVSQFQDRILSLASQYGVSATEVTGSAADFRQANFTIAESFDLVNTSLIATNISELSAAEASNLLKRALAGFGAPASDAAKLLDIFNEVSNNANSNVRELAIGFADISPIANQLGLSFEETIALLTPIIEVFGSGSEAAIALKTGFARLIDPTKDIRETLASVGIAQKDANGQFLTGVPLLRSIQGAFQDLTPAQQQAVAESVAGAQQFARLTIALDRTSREAEILNVATTATGSAQRELEVRLQATEVQLSRLVESARNAAIALGSEFLPETKGVLSAATGLGDALRDAIAGGALDGLLNALRPFFGEIQSTLTSISANLGDALGGLDFSRFAEALDGLRSAFDGLFGGVDLNTAEGLQSALQDIVNVGAALIEFTNGAIEAFTPFVRALASGATGAADLGSDFATLLGRIGGISSIITTVTPAVSSLGQAIEALGNVIVVATGAKILAGSQNLDVLGASASRLSGLLGKAGLIVGGAGAVVGTGVLVGEVLNRVPILGDVFKSLGSKVSDLVADIAGLDDALGQMVFTQDELTKASDYTAEKITSQAIAIAEATKVQGELNKSGKTLEETFNDIGLTFDASTGRVETLATTAARAGQDFQFAEDQASDLIQTVGPDGEKSFSQFGSAVVKATGPLAAVAKKAKEAKDESDELQIKLEEIASNERIKRIEAFVDLQVAQVEADAQKINDIIEGLNNTFGSTGEVISSALGALGDVDGFFGLEKLELITKQLEYENQLRADAAEQQKALTDATIEEVKARTKALREGGGLIQISAEGLEPALELVLFEILKRIQVRANESAADFLLAVG